MELVPVTVNPFDYEPPVVTRVNTYETITSIDFPEGRRIVVASNPSPPCPKTDGDLATLRWRAALLEHDLGRKVRVVVHPVHHSYADDPEYQERYEVMVDSRWLMGPLSFTEATVYMDGLAASSAPPDGMPQPAIHNTLDDVHTFMRLAKQMTDGKFQYEYSHPLRVLRRDLLHEEYQTEYVAAERCNDLAEIVDGLIDIIWIAQGSLLAHIGAEATNACLREVSRANMSKVIGDGLPKFREDGKVLKPEGFEPPNIKRILQSLGKM